MMYDSWLHLFILKILGAILVFKLDGKIEFETFEDE